MGVEFLAINVLLHTKSEQKFTVINFVRQQFVKNRIFIKKETFTICVERTRFLIVGYFLFEKQTFNEILKFIGIQRLFYCSVHDT